MNYSVKFNTCLNFKYLSFESKQKPRVAGIFHWPRMDVETLQLHCGNKDETQGPVHSLIRVNLVSVAVLSRFNEIIETQT